MKLDISVLTNHTAMSLDERFTQLRRADSRLLVRGISDLRQHFASTKSRRLALQMSRRPSVIAALNGRRGFGGNLGRRGSQILRGGIRNIGRGRRSGSVVRGGNRPLRRSGSVGRLSRSQSLTSLNSQASLSFRTRGWGRGRGGPTRGGRGVGGFRRGGLSQRGGNISSGFGTRRGRGAGGGNFRLSRGRGRAAGTGRGGGSGRGAGAGAGAGSGGRGAGSGRRGTGGRGRRGRRPPPPSKEKLDMELDEYMASSRATLDKEIDSYMSQTQEKWE